MFNPYQTRSVKLLKVRDQAPGIKLFEFGFEQRSFRLDGGEPFSFWPGQFVILSFPGFGEAPFAPCNDGRKNLEICVRSVGKLTQKLHSLKPGDKAGIRGPFGNGWPIVAKRQAPSAKRNLLIVVGGLGLVPLRSLILGRDYYLNKETQIQIFYGAKSPEEFLFKEDLKLWKNKGIDVQLTIDKECEGWKECVGLVTALFERSPIVESAKAFLCGPPVMYRSVLELVKKHNFADEDIYLSLERRMHCGVGVCQHCGVGSYYCCKQGPVFSYPKIKNIPGAI